MPCSGLLCIQLQLNQGDGLSNLNMMWVQGVVEFMEAAEDQWVDNGDISVMISDITWTEGSETKTAYYLREGIERFMITDINNPAASAMSQSEIVIYFDQFGPGDNIRWSNHVPGGSNILFLDGHVEFWKYPASYPLSKEFMAVFTLGL